MRIFNLNLLYLCFFLFSGCLFSQSEGEVQAVQILDQMDSNDLKSTKVKFGKVSQDIIKQKVNQIEELRKKYDTEIQALYQDIFQIVAIKAEEKKIEYPYLPQFSEDFSEAVLKEVEQKEKKE